MSRLNLISLFAMNLLVAVACTMAEPRQAPQQSPVYSLVSSSQRQPIQPVSSVSPVQPIIESASVNHVAHSSPVHHAQVRPVVRNSIPSRQEEPVRSAVVPPLAAAHDHPGHPNYPHHHYPGAQDSSNLRPEYRQNLGGVTLSVGRSPYGTGYSVSTGSLQPGYNNGISYGNGYGPSGYLQPGYVGNGYGPGYNTGYGNGGYGNGGYGNNIGYGNGYGSGYGYGGRPLHGVRATNSFVRRQPHHSS